MAPYLNKPLIRETENKKYIEVIGHYDNPVLCAKLTLLAELYAVEHKEGYALFKVEDYDKLSKINDKLEFSVSDLTGTTWVFNNTIDASDTDFTLNFVSNGYNYTGIGFNEDGNGDMEYNGGPSGSAHYIYDPFRASPWAAEAYKTIQITGGTDVTNATLIAWLQANATQQVEPTPTGVNNLSFGNLPIESISFGNLPIEKVYIGENLVYQVGEPTPPTPSGYEVTFTFNEHDIYAKYGVYIYDGTDDTGTLLFSDTNAGTATPTTTVTCTSGHLYIYASGAAGSFLQMSPDSVSGGVTSDGNDTFTVIGDGTVTMSIYYDD